MLISTHLPPPVITERTAALAFMTHILCWSCGMYFSAATTSENDQGSMNLASKTVPVCSTHPVEGRRHPADYWVLDPPLYVGNDLPGIALEPMPIEGLGHEAKLDDEIVGEVLRLSLAAFLAPQPEQGSLVAPHDDPGVGAADEAPAIKAFGGDPCGLEREGHDALQFSC